MFPYRRNSLKDINSTSNTFKTFWLQVLRTIRLFLETILVDLISLKDSLKENNKVTGKLTKNWLHPQKESHKVTDKLTKNWLHPQAKKTEHVGLDNF